MGEGCAGLITMVSPATDGLAAFLGGFAAAEGYFGKSGTPPRFAFVIGLGATDSGTCELLRKFLGVGTLHWFPRRRDHYDDEASFHVRALKDLIEVVVPFMDEHLPPSHKREQYLCWRQELVSYWETNARRRRPCKVEGCGAPSRAFGLCRHHYFLEFRR